MPLWSTLATPAPYHILGFGLLFGSSIFQSFINGIVAYRSLTRPQFSILQQNLFPIYFSMQTTLSLLSLLTSPLLTVPYYTLGLSTLCGAANFLFVGPKTTAVMNIRKRQETIDGRDYNGKKNGTWENAKMRGGDMEKEDVLISPEMKTLNKSFSIWHGISSAVNLVAIIGSIVYGIELSERL